MKKTNGKPIKELIEDILRENVSARDCDYKLYSILLKKLDINTISTSLFRYLTWQANGGYTDTGKYIPCISVVSRRRREIQRSNPALMGTRRQARIAEEDKVLEEYNYKQAGPNAPGTTP